MMVWFGDLPWKENAPDIMRCECQGGEKELCRGVNLLTALLNQDKFWLLYHHPSLRR